MRFAFLFRTESRHVHPKSRPAVGIVLDLPDATTLAQALDAAHKAGMGKGSSRTGCFEVQCGHGLWMQVDGNRIELDTPAKVAKVRYMTWAQWEGCVEAGRDPLAK